MLSQHRVFKGFFAEPCNIRSWSSLEGLKPVLRKHVEQSGSWQDLQQNFCFYGFATVQWSLGAGQCFFVLLQSAAAARQT